MDTEIIIGSVQRFLVINTTEYNNDGAYAVAVCDKDELSNHGISPEEIITLVNTDKDVMLDDLSVGEIGVPEWPGGGVYVMRIA